MDRFSSDDESSDESRSEIPVRNVVSPSVLAKIDRYLVEVQSSIQTGQFKGEYGRFEGREKMYIFKNENENDILVIASSKAILNSEVFKTEYEKDPVQGTSSHNDIMYLLDPKNRISVITPSGNIMQFDGFRLVAQHAWRFNELSKVVSLVRAKKIVELLEIKDDRARNNEEIIRLLNPENGGGKKQKQRSTKRFKKRGKKPKTRSRRFHYAIK